MLILGPAQSAFSQTADSTAHILNFKGNVSVTNNGFSFIPTFSLGKPAAIVQLAIDGGKRGSFEPEFRYSLEGKPWSFVFIWRYKLVKRDKFQLMVGTHLPALNFKTVAVVKSGDSLNVIQSSRFFPVVELSPNWLVSKNIGIGLFYLYGRGIEKGVPKNGHFLTLRGNFSNIKLAGKYYLRFNPQFFYLNQDRRDGFYAASNLTLARRGFPFSFSTMMNKKLHSEIAGKGFDWNVSLVYSFNKNYSGH